MKYSFPCQRATLAIIYAAARLTALRYFAASRGVAILALLPILHLLMCFYFSEGTSSDRVRWESEGKKVRDNENSLTIPLLGTQKKIAKIHYFFFLLFSPRYSLSFLSASLRSSRSNIIREISASIAIAVYLKIRSNPELKLGKL